LLTASVLPLLKDTLAKLNNPAPELLVFWPANVTVAPLRGARLAATSTRPETDRVPVRVSTVVTFESAAPVVARATGHNTKPRNSPAITLQFVSRVAAREDFGARNLFRFNGRESGGVKTSSRPGVAGSRSGMNSALLWLRLRGAAATHARTSNQAKR
jgi:hypothetical protein